MDPQRKTNTCHLMTGEMAVKSGDWSLATDGIGSCLVVCLLDRANGVGGMAHVFLPDGPARLDPTAPPARDMTTAIPFLIERMARQGANPRHLTGIIAGGGRMFPDDSFNVGAGNIAAARALFRTHGVRLVGEAVGGELGRRAVFDLESATATIMTGDDRVTVLDFSCPALPSFPRQAGEPVTPSSFPRKRESRPEPDPVFLDPRFRGDDEEKGGNDEVCLPGDYAGGGTAASPSGPLGRRPSRPDRAREIL